MKLRRVNVFFSNFLNYLGKGKKALNEGKRLSNILPTRKNENNKLINYSNLEDITYKEIDGKLDPNEPIYCYCNYISYGDMVKCDNPKVNFVINP